jgi:hypothetical protein
VSAAAASVREDHHTGRPFGHLQVTLQHDGADGDLDVTPLQWEPPDRSV